LLDTIATLKVERSYVMLRFLRNAYVFCIQLERKEFLLSLSLSLSQSFAVVNTLKDDTAFISRADEGTTKI